MSICLAADHYPQLDLPAEYDARLHNYGTETPCEYATREAPVRCEDGHETIAALTGYDMAHCGAKIGESTLCMKVAFPKEEQ